MFGGMRNVIAKGDSNDMRVRVTRLVMLLAVLLARPLCAQLQEAPASPPPDDRLKADILVFVAHADDDTLLYAYLARAIYDEHKRVAVIYTTIGEHGENRVGYEQGAALALVREQEARSALAALGVFSVWFLGAPNVPSPLEDPLGSLERWPHGLTLEKTVRLIRLIRPEVVITWLPDYVVGENHCDHQAAGILATEAYDLAGDPLVFPEQVTPPLDHRGFGNLTEGLHAWQPKKLYFVSDASHADFLQGVGPVYSGKGVSPSRGIPYSRIVAQEVSYYLSQSEGLPAKQALASGNTRDYETPVHLIFGKSSVKSSVTGDVFEGVSPGSVRFAPPRGNEPESPHGLSLELGSPWHFYRQFWKAHNLDHLAQLHAPEIGLKDGQTAPCTVLLLIRNDTDHGSEVRLTVALPAGWKELQGTARYPVPAHDVYPVRAEFVALATSQPEWKTVTWNADADGTRVGSVSLRVFSAPSGLSFRPIDEPGRPDE